MTVESALTKLAFVVGKDGLTLNGKRLVRSSSYAGFNIGNVRQKDD